MSNLVETDSAWLFFLVLTAQESLRVRVRVPLRVRVPPRVRVPLRVQEPLRVQVSLRLNSNRVLCGAHRV